MKLPGIVLSLLLAGIPAPAMAWSNHSLGTALALKGSSSLEGVAPVEVESLESFLSAEAEGLQVLLDSQEAYARASFQGYPERPDELRWIVAGEGDRRQDFLQALRINPETKLATFVQPVPGTSDWKDRPLLPMGQVMVYRDLSQWGNRYRFYEVQPGDRLSALSVVATASDEPDYGHDINLFSDTPGSAGTRYNFGPQPFGDSRFEYSSQAPFHMGFYHESGLLTTAAPYLAKTYPEQRAFQYFGLARYAFETGHPYWGYRFLGWGLHYVQDLTQPYHAKVMPGSSTANLLWVSVKDMLGYPDARAAVLKRVADRHTAIESFQLAWLSSLIAEGNSANPMFNAYSDTASDKSYPSYDVDYLRNVVSAQAYASADELDKQIGLSMASSPQPSGFTDSNKLVSSNQVDPQMQAVLVELIRHYGAHSRNAVAASVPGAVDK
ncbi:phospholipase [Pseudomonas sp. N040]|uniref:phospholipase n=1 Tax=Pseudomonas sp. N040 TaxID=2785325 RepID=UPI0018A2F53E|nr:phospholipase [Pseudomonas sp. N040]MBF7731528.1 phospholipase [Pseudomonas sp. N040]MBW7015172.1 phospholipase [Pseudomonas sp. N040]